MNQTITLTQHTTPIGDLTAFWQGNNIIGLTSSKNMESSSVYRKISKQISHAKFVRLLKAPANLQEQLNDYFKAKIRCFTIPMQLLGTPFQQQVWRQVMAIPYGQTRTYSDIGLIINSRAYRAIGSAMRVNPLPLLIPCHRVVSAKGVGNYSLFRGQPTKQFLLNMEAKHRDI